MPAQPSPPSPSQESDRTERNEVLRELILEASLDVLDRVGLGLQPDVVTYARVFAHLAENHGVQISRGSVHGRIWNSQEDYRFEVLAAAVRHSSPDDRSRAMQEAATHVLDRLAGLDRRDRLAAFCRISARALLDASLESDSFRRFQAIKAVARAAGHDIGGEAEAATAFLRSIVAESIDGDPATRTDTFRFVFDILGLRPRPALGLHRDQAIDLFLTMVQTLVTGAHLDNHAGFTATAAKVETALPAEEGCPWTSFAFGHLAFMEFLFEPDPDAGTDTDTDTDDRQNGDPPAAEPTPVTDDIGPPDLATLVGDRPRRSREDLRRLVVAAGVELLLRDGIGLQAETITYTRVFEHVKRTRGITLHRSTVHPHLWSSQSQFRSDVLAEAARFDTCEALATMRQAMAAQTVTRNPDSSVNVRQLILDNSLATMSAQLRVATTSPSFRRWQLIKAATLSPAPYERIDDIRQAVQERYGEMVDVFADTYRSVLPFVDLEVNPELGMTDDQAYHLLAVICATVSTGADFDIAAGSERVGRVVPLPRADGSGDVQHWPIPAIAALATLDLLFVPRTRTEDGTSPATPTGPPPH